MTNYAGITTITIGAVAAISLFIAILLWVAADRVANPKIKWVSAGFFVMALKSVIIAAAILTSFLAHELVELVDAVFDLLVVLLVAAPFLMRR